VENLKQDMEQRLLPLRLVHENDPLCDYAVREAHHFVGRKGDSDLKRKALELETKANAGRC
jgi:hypothetical protein